MASEPVTAEQYPNLTTFELTSASGGRGGIVGRITKAGLPCTRCRTDNTVTIYQGPQHGLAFDVPETPFDVAPVELELTWCTEHGHAGMRLINQDGTDHTGL